MKLLRKADLIGSVRAFRRFISLSGSTCQLKIKFQSKPPTCMESMAVRSNSNVESSITSIRGTTDAFRLRAIGSSNGSNQPFHREYQAKFQTQ